MLTDAELLTRFSESGDEPAFAELARRHGAMVYRACLALLADAHEAEDAAQAAFLVLARKARSLGREGNLAAWLHGVAARAAREALRARARRARREEEAAMLRAEAAGTADDPRRGALLAALHRELQALPEVMRQAVILRYLEGRSEEEAAGLVGCPQGTLSKRASRGLEKLRARLGGRDAAISGAALVGLLGAEAQATVPAALLPSIAAVAHAGAAGAAAGSKALMLAEGTMRAMLIAKVKLAAAALCAIAVVGSSIPVALRLAAAEPAPEPKVATKTVIQPLEKAVWKDVLEPVLDWETSSWAKEPCYARVQGDAVEIGNGFLGLRLGTGLKSAELTNRTTGEKLELPAGALFRAEFVEDGKGTWVESSALAELKAAAEGGGDSARATVTGKWAGGSVALNIEVRKKEAVIRLRPEFANSGPKDVLLRTLSFAWPKDAHCPEGSQFLGLKQKAGGFFAAIEFPFLPDRSQLHYSPGWTIKPGGKYLAEPVACWVYRNHHGGAGPEQAAEGLWAWSMAYVRSISPYRHELICHHQSWTGGGDPRPEDFPAWKAMGVRSHMSGCANWATKPPSRTPEGYWGEPGKSREAFENLAKQCSAAGLDLTAWGGCENLFTCMASDEAKAFQTWILALVKRYGLKGFEFDVLGAAPGSCQAAAHGHLAGKDGVYVQARAWYDFVRELRAAGAGILGHHGTFYETYSQMHYDLNHTGNDPANAMPVPTVSAAHNFTDFHRQYLLAPLLWPAVGTAPHRLYVEVGLSGCTCGGGFDPRGWRYSLVSTASMTPTLIFMVIQGMPEADVKFTRQWVDWTRENRDYLLLMGRPLFGSYDQRVHINTRSTQAYAGVVGFNHVRGDRGYFALHNAAFAPQEVDLEIGVEAEAPGLLAIQQLYPFVEQPIPGPEAQCFKKGSRLRLTLPPRAVRLFKIGPPAFIGEKLMYAGSVEQVVDPQEGLYLGGWKLLSAEGGKLRLATALTAPAALKKCLADQANWPKDFGKTPYRDLAPYLVPLLAAAVSPDKAKTTPLSLRPPPGLALEAVVNGEKRTVEPVTAGHQFYYALRLANLKPQGENQIELVIPDQEGLAFRGCYLDLPDRYRE